MCPCRLRAWTGGATLSRLPRGVRGASTVSDDDEHEKRGWGDGAQTRREDGPGAHGQGEVGAVGSKHQRLVGWGQEPGGPGVLQRLRTEE